MNYTKNYNLSMPENSDIVDINVLSQNFETIDETLGNTQETIQNFGKNAYYRDNLLVDGGIQVWLDNENISFADELVYGPTIWKNAFEGEWSISKIDTGGIYIFGENISGGITQELGDAYYFTGEKMMLSMKVNALQSVVASAKIVISDEIQGEGITLVASEQEILVGEQDVLFSFDTSDIIGSKYIAITILDTNLFTGSISIKQSKLEFGETVTPFNTETYSQAKYAVERYYEQTWNDVWEADTQNFSNAIYGHAYSRDLIYFNSEKRIVPTIKTYIPYSKIGGVYNNSGYSQTASVVGTGTKMFFLNYVIVSTYNHSNEIKYFHFTADARLY
ncbi:MAG: hypothetical protein R3Y12_02385 [Clostridia bacterium]